MRSLLAAPTVTYCEQAVRGLIKRPWSALSNLAFIGVGISILLSGKGSRLSRLFGGIALLIGVVSTFYDITYIYGLQLLDLTGMLVFVGLLLYLNLSALGLKKRILPSISASIAFAVLLIVLFQGYMGDVVFGAYVVGVIITQLMLFKLKKHENQHLWLVAFGVFIVGFCFWLADSTRYYCSDFGLLNGRAIFHYCAAASIYLLFRFYDRQTDLDTR